MRNNALNVVLFLFLAGAMFFLYQHADDWFPKPDKKKDEAKPEVVDDQKKKDEQAKKDGKQPDGPKEPPKVGPPSPPPPPPEPPTLVALGGDNFYTRVLLTTRGGGVQQVVLPRFEQADRLGRPVKDAGKPVPFYLIPGVPQPRSRELREDYPIPAIGPGKVADPSILAEPSYTVFHYPTPDDKYPDPRLGEINWKEVEKRLDGSEHKVVFETELGSPYFLKLRKTYTLGEKDYHVGLRLDIERLPGGEKGKGQTRLQISGPRGMPIEGEWYTTTHRAAVIGWTDPKGAALRKYEDAASIGARRGGDDVPGRDNTFKYMAVTTQYFTSGLAISDQAKAEGALEKPWGYVRATTELPFDRKQDINQPYFDDVTVRAVSETIDLEPGQKLAHSYLIYNGPSKVRLLKLASEKQGAVAPALVDRYSDALMLRTITDYRSDTWIGRIADFIYWTDLVIVFTNLMHWLLAVIHSALGGWAGSWALSIVLLTVFVRMLLLVPSRKQTAMSMKMMEVQKRLKPEFDKLYEKYKDDLHTYNREKTRLMMQHGANPFAAMGGCLLLFAQMPIMMGLYFCLQESVFFRLQPFLWIDNLAAPDMLFWWSEKIPFVSTPEDMGSFIYMGPYFNLLPILAVGLMLYQQAKMMPPSTDPQAEQQRVMMKIMMVMMAFFFYKVAAGLALYFIVSTGWGIIERQFIPKPKIDGLDNADAKSQAGSSNGKSATPTGAVQEKSKGRLGRLREALQKKLEEMQRNADEQSRRQIRNDPNRPGGPQDDQGDGNRRDRDKKKRKRK